MDVEDLEKKAEANKKKYIYIYNPLSVDFKCSFDYGDEVKSHTIYSRENIKLRYDAAQVIGEHLIDAYLQHRNIKESRSLARKRARELIYEQD